MGFNSAFKGLRKTTRIVNILNLNNCGTSIYPMTFVCCLQTDLPNCALLPDITAIQSLELLYQSVHWRTHFGNMVTDVSDVVF